MLKFFGAAVLAASLATSAMAVVSVSSVNGPDSAPGPVVFDFDTTLPGLSGNFAIVNGPSSGVYAPPLGDETDYLTVPKDLSINPVSATLDLGGKFETVSFYWGSIDKYNSVSFYKGGVGGTFLGTVAGDTTGVNAPADGSQGLPSNNRRVTFSFGGQRADTLVLTSTQYAFEIDDIAGTAVPEPSTWAMLIGGMGLVGASMRRRRTVTSVVA